MSTPFAWLGAPNQPPDLGAWTAYVTGLRDNLKSIWSGSLIAYKTLKSTREALDLPFIDDSTPVGGEGGSAAVHGAWTTDLDTQAQDIQAMVTLVTTALDDVLAGKRKMQWSQQDGQFVIEGLPDDLLRLVQKAPEGTPVLVSTSTGQPTHVTGQLGMPAMFWVATAATFTTTVFALPVYFAVTNAAKALTDVAEQKTMQTIAERQYDCVQSGKCTPEQAAKLTGAIYGGAAGLREAKAKEEAAANKPTSDLADAAKNLGWVALGLGIVYLVVKTLPLLTAGRGGGAPMLPAPAYEENPRWSRKYKDELPDSAFLYVDTSRATHRDERGRSHPLSVRKLPVVDKQGRYNCKHIRNAIGRAPQAYIPAHAVREAQAKGRRLLDKYCPLDNVGVGLLNNPTSELDETAADGLLMHISHTDSLSMVGHGKGMKITRDMLRRMRNGRYNHELAIKGWMYLVDDAARDYVREYREGQKWSELFNAATRRKVAQDLTDLFEQRANLGELNHLLPAAA